MPRRSLSTSRPSLIALLASLLLAACVDAPPRSATSSAPQSGQVAPATAVALRPLPTDWQRGAFAEIYVRAYRDSDGDGIGDLRGLIESLDYLQALGVRGLWLMPITASQDHDHGYATTSFRDIEPAYGTLADFDELLRQAHARGIGVIIDYVINHSAAEHPLFQQALHDRNSPYRRWYVWEDEKPPGWTIFKKDPWNVTPTGSYFSVFSPTMPDFNFREPAVLAFHEDNLRFWLDRGVDGFRFDAVSHLVENGPIEWRDQPQTMVVLGRLRAVIDSYSGRFMVCEATRQARRYAAPSACGNVFALEHSGDLFAAARGDAAAIAKVADYYAQAPAAMAGMLSNHDLFAGERAWDQLDGDTARYKLAAATYLLQPGTPFILYGEEIGMSAAPLEGDRRVRAPMPWTADPRTAGFTTGTPFRALPSNAATQNVADEQTRPHGLLSWYRDLLRVRNAHRSLSIGDYASPRVDGLVMSYQRRSGIESSVVVINYGTAAATTSLAGLPPGTHFRQVFPGNERDAFDASEGNGPAMTLAPQSVRVYVGEQAVQR